MRGRHHGLRNIGAALCIAFSASCGPQIFDPINRDPGEPAAFLASIGGLVRDQGTLLPIAGATVEAGGVSAVTKADGTYELRDIQASVVLLVTSKADYETSSTLLPLTTGHNTRVITLRSLAALDLANPDQGLNQYDTLRSSVLSG